MFQEISLMWLYILGFYCIQYRLTMVFLFMSTLKFDDSFEGIFSVVLGIYRSWIGNYLSIFYWERCLFTSISCIGENHCNRIVHTMKCLDKFLMRSPNYFPFMLELHFLISFWVYFFVPI
jgi:hypothetical protein